MDTFSNTSYQCYFDNAATTRVRDEVADIIVDVLKNNYGNPSSTHSYGRPSKSLIEVSRKEIAAHLNVSASEIIFTSGGTEADNLILRSAARDLNIKHFISSKIEEVYLPYVQTGLPSLIPENQADLAKLGIPF